MDVRIADLFSLAGLSAHHRLTLLTPGAAYENSELVYRFLKLCLQWVSALAAHVHVFEVLVR